MSQSTEFLFPKHSTVEHTKTGTRYIVVITPDRGMLEESDEPAYAYSKDGSKIFFRSQKKMEDGRFIPVPPDKANTA